MQSSATDLAQFGVVSEFFWRPLLPKVVILGLNSDQYVNIREILSKAFENVLNVEFQEQYVVPSSHSSKNSRSHSHFPNASWFENIRFKRASVVIDYIKFESIDSVSDQVSQYKSQLANGPAYMLWIGSHAELPTYQKSVIAKQFQLSPSQVFILNSSASKDDFLSNLKPIAKACFEAARPFYRHYSDKYKSRISSPSMSAKFIQPWMQNIYYSFKMAFLEELKGDLESALKYYHSILAKYKQMIEESKENSDLMLQILNYLRPSSEIGFLKISFLLFRLDQTTEAEFGLFRYLSYFAQGLNPTQERIWRSSIARLFATLLDHSFFWNPNNRLIPRGPSHFLIYSILNSQEVLKVVNGADSLSVHDQLISDTINAIQSCSDSLVHMNVYLQLQLIKYYESFGSDEVSKPFVEYLKNEQLIKNWNCLLTSVLNHSLQLVQSNQADESQVIDSWYLACLKETINGFPLLCQAALKVFELSAKPALLNFAAIPNHFLPCSVKVEKRKVQLGEENAVNLAVFNNSLHEFIIESIGVFFNDERFDAVVFDVKDPLLIQPSTMIKLKAKFLPAKATESPLQVAFVTMQLKQPYISIQYNASNLIFSNNVSNVSWDICSSADGIKFMSFASSILKRNLQFTVSKIDPVLQVNFSFETKCYCAIPVPVQVILTNTSDQPIVGEISFATETYSIIQGHDGNLLQQAINFSLGAEAQTSLKIFVKVFERSKLTASVKSQHHFDTMDMRLAEVYNSSFYHQSFHLDIYPQNLFDLVLNKELLHHSVQVNCVTTRFKLVFSFLNSTERLSVSDSALVVNESRFPCSILEGANLALLGEADFTADSNAKLEATFEFDPNYAPINYTWSLPKVFGPSGIFVYHSIEDPDESVKLNSPFRFSWKIFNYTDQRLEVLACPVCGPNVVFQGANQKHLLLSPGGSEVMKGFVFFKSNTSALEIPYLLLKDRFGKEIAYISNPSTELKIST